jgi:HTH-type transcriptional regulator/antitoxin HigA
MTHSYTPYLNIGPGDFIQEELEVRNWRQEDLADILGVSKKTINEIINNKQSITIEMARLLSQAFGPSPQYWINLDTNYRLRLAGNQSRSNDVECKSHIYNYMPVHEMVKKGWIDAFATTRELVDRVKEFWNIEKLDLSFLDKSFLPRFRKSEAYEQFNEYYAQVWFQMAKKCAGRYAVPPFDKRELTRLASRLSDYTRQEDGVIRFIRDLNAAGVKFFVLSHLPKTYIDGAAYFDNKSPVIIYTNRYDRTDHFWFTVSHELSHVLRHIKTTGDYIIDEPNRNNPSIEEQANNDAELMLGKSKILDFFKRHKPPVTKVKVITCAALLQVGEAIIVGLLQHHNLLSRRSLNHFKDSVAGLIPEHYWPEKTGCHR